MYQPCLRSRLQRCSYSLQKLIPAYGERVHSRNLRVSGQCDFAAARCK